MTLTKNRAGTWLVWIFVLSGFSGLIYQSIWTQYLGLFLGHSSYAQSLVLILFMGGMAVGAWLVSRWSSSVRRPLLAYAVIEVVIGLLGLCFDGIYQGLTGWAYDQLLPMLPASQLQNVRWVLAAAMVLPQCILLGATFPLMSAGYIRLQEHAEGRACHIDAAGARRRARSRPHQSHAESVEDAFGLVGVSCELQRSTLREGHRDDPCRLAVDADGHEAVVVSAGRSECEVGRCGFDGLGALDARLDLVTFRVDQLEVKSDDGIDQSQLWVGKYLTPKLLVRYVVGIFDQAFSFGIEYQLTDSFRIEAESGETKTVDLIYKIER